MKTIKSIQTKTKKMEKISPTRWQLPYLRKLQIGLFFVVAVLGVAFGFYKHNEFVQMLHFESIAKAAVAHETVSLYFNPDTINLPPAASLKLMLDAKTNYLSFVRVRLGFNPQAVKLTGEIDTAASPLKTVVYKTTAAEANDSGSAVLVLALSPDNQSPTGIIQLASLPFSAVSTLNSQTQITISAEDMQIVATDTSELQAVIQPATVNLNSSSPTPTPTVISSPTPSPAPIPTTTTLRFNPTKDSSVYQSYPSTNYGTKTTLETDGSPVKTFWITFNPGTISGTITGAKVRLKNVDSSSVGGNLYYSSNDAWSETGITWNNQPVVDGQLLYSQGKVSSGNWYEWDVTKAINTNEGQYTFVMKSSYSDGADYKSKEDATEKPELVITVAN